jgi:beta-galactosidase
MSKTNAPRTPSGLARLALNLGAAALAFVTGSAGSHALAAATTALPAPVPTASAPAERPNGHLTELPLLSGWRFHLGNPAGAEAKTFTEDASWRSVSLPHDWSIEGPIDQKNPSGRLGGFFPYGIGWYRTTLARTAAMRGKQVFIEFDGVMHLSEVFCNGRSLGQRPSGHITFRYDLTPHLVDGDNVLAVRVGNATQIPHRWYTGSGINRQVRLVLLNPVHLAFDGLHLQTPVATAERAELTVQTRLVNSRPTPQTATLTTVVRSPAQVELSRTQVQVTLAPGETALPVATLPPIDRPQRWSPETPFLYTLVTEVTTADGLQDRKVVPFGVRSIRYAADGFYLNERKSVMRGVCLHQDAGGLGSAVPLSVWERRLLQLKSVGCNAIRTSHGGVAPEFLDLCDRLGFLVMAEYFDSWEKAKTPGDYSTYFKEWWKRDLTESILRDRNHPSIVLWSAGNEVNELGLPDPALTEAKRIYSEIAAVFHALAPDRPVTVGCHHPERYKLLDNGFAQLMDVAGFNYAVSYVSRIRPAQPDLKVIGTENRSGLGSWRDLVNSNHAGGFLWTGIDYLGESKGWPFINRPFGLFDRCGNPYPVAFDQAMAWSPLPRVAVCRTLPSAVGNKDRAATTMVMDWWVQDWNPGVAPGTPTEIRVWSTCEAVEIRLNGQSLGIHKPSARDRSLDFTLPYAPGTLEVIGLQGGKPVCQDRLVTAGPATAVTLAPDRLTATTAFDDVVAVPFTIVDAHGTRVPDAAARVTLAVTGPGRLVSIDNADPASHESFTGPSRTTYRGRGLAYIRATGVGEITVSATANGLKPARVTLQGVAGTWTPAPAVFTGSMDPLPWGNAKGAAAAVTSVAATDAPATAKTPATKAGQPTATAAPVSVSLTQGGAPILTTTLPAGWTAVAADGRITITPLDEGLTVDLRLLPAGTSVTQVAGDLERLLDQDLLTIRTTRDLPLTVAGAPAKQLNLFACAVSDGQNIVGFAGLFTVKGRTGLLLAYSRDDTATERTEKALLGILQAISPAP